MLDELDKMDGRTSPRNNEKNLFKAVRDMKLWIAMTLQIMRERVRERLDCYNFDLYPFWKIDRSDYSTRYLLTLEQPFS